MTMPSQPEIINEIRGQGDAESLERERCARIAETFYQPAPASTFACNLIAARIRSGK
jgi:hypothetical protein